LDHKPNAVQVEGAFERPRAPSVVIVAILAGVLVALVKPWSFGGSGAPDAGSSPRASGAVGVVSSASPAPAPSLQVDPNGMLCLGGDVEQVVAYERSANAEVEVRNWVAVDDVPATGPADPRLVRIAIFSSNVIGLGICGPFAGDGVPVAGRIIDVQLAPTTPGKPMQDLGRPRQITLELGGQDAAVLYGSPQELVATPDPAYQTSQPSPGRDGSGGIGAELPTLRPWSTGRYAVAFAFAWDGAEAVRWLGINLLPGPGEPR
jgi:hypothetical protein